MITASTATITGWLCLPVGAACAVGVVHVAPWMVARYTAIYGAPHCSREVRCTVPAREWAPGGMFYGMGNGYGVPGAGYALAPAGAYPLGSYASGGASGGAGYASAPAATPVADTAPLIAPQPASVALVAPYVPPGAVSPASPVQVPEPAAWTVFAVAVVGITAIKWRRA